MRNFTLFLIPQYIYACNAEVETWLVGFFIVPNRESGDLLHNLCLYEDYFPMVNRLYALCTFAQSQLLLSFCIFPAQSRVTQVFYNH